VHQKRGLQVLEQKVPISCNFKADFGDEIPIFTYFTFYASLIVQLRWDRMPCKRRWWTKTRKWGNYDRTLERKIRETWGNRHKITHGK